jgi:DNA-binding transcriptional regulator YiaG
VTIGDIVTGRSWLHVTGGSLKQFGRDGRAKLTAEQRQQIRDDTDSSQQALARRFGVSQPYVSNLRGGKR